MKSFLFAMMLSLCGAAYGADWMLTTVMMGDIIIGHVYHTSAIGTQTEFSTGNTKEKVTAGLRIVCPSKNHSSIKNNNPIIAILWSGFPVQGTPHSVEIKVDNNKPFTEKWMQYNQVIYKFLDESLSLINEMKTGGKISFSWADAHTRRSVIFDIQDFDSRLTDFNAVCSTQL